MEKSEMSSKLEAIIEKRKNCIPLTNDEEKLVNESLDKLLDAKKCVNKTLSHTTGDEIRKTAGSSPVLPTAPSTDKGQEGVPPQDRGKAGGYESKADVAERQPAQATDAQPVPPVKKDKNLTDKKEEAKPTEDNKGKPYGDKTKEEWADVDNKKFKQENYEEDRIGRATEHANYPDSIKTQDIVVKTVAGGRKVVGQVLKVYHTTNGQTGLMVKWSDGRFEHVNQANVELLKAVVVRPKLKTPAEIKENETEKGVIADVVTEAIGVGAGVLGGDLASAAILHPHKPKQPKAAKPNPNPDGTPHIEADGTTKSVANATLGVVTGEAIAGLPGAVVGGVAGALTGNKPKVKKDADDTPKETEKVVSDKKTKLEEAMENLGTHATEKVTGALRPDETTKAASLPTEAPEDFIRGVVDTLKEITDLSEEEIINVAKSAWAEIAAENTEKAAKAKDVKKDSMYDGESNVATTPTDRHDEATPGSIGPSGETGNVLNPKTVETKDVKKDEPKE